MGRIVSAGKSAKKNPHGVRIRFKMVVGDGFEPSKAWPVDLQSTAFDRSATPPRRTSLERVEGIEPSQSAWKADVLPLNYTRMTSSGIQ